MSLDDIEQILVDMSNDSYRRRHLKNDEAFKCVLSWKRMEYMSSVSNKPDRELFFTYYTALLYKFYDNMHLMLPLTVECNELEGKILSLDMCKETDRERGIELIRHIMELKGEINRLQVKETEIFIEMRAIEALLSILSK